MEVNMRFRNRQEAGRQLARALDAYRNQEAVVFALPRGGVVLGVEIAKYLHAPMDLIIPRKVGHPRFPEYAVCAVTEDGHLVCNQDEVTRLDPDWLKAAIAKEQAEAKRRRLRYLANRPAVPVKGKTAIVTDDGVATGLTMLAAINDLRDRQPAKVVLAVPILPQDIALQLQKHVDEVVALDIPRNYLGSVGAYYDEFDQVEDEAVIKLLDSLQADTPKQKGGQDG
jgi:putative phosphoribosyl transferase